MILRSTRAGALGLALLCTAAGAAMAGSETSVRLPVDRASLNADFHGEAASGEARQVARWVVVSGDNASLPFAIIDKVDARVFVFDSRGVLRGASPALLGLTRGDDSAAGIGDRPLSAIKPSERVTPAGRFVAAVGHDLEQDILWIDYGAALSMHRVIKGTPREHRAQRLASSSPLDRRISYGCINVPAPFYDTVVAPTFTAAGGIVYILPETRPNSAVFPMDLLKTEATTRLR